MANAFLLLCYTTAFLFILCIAGGIAELLMKLDERNDINIKVGDCLRGKK